MRCVTKFSFANHLKLFNGYVFILLWIMQGACAQRPPYSLQAAVDELHRREAATYPLNAPPAQPHFFAGIGTSSDLDYWDDDSDFPVSTNNKNRNRHRINKALAKYLERENYEADHGGLSLGPFGVYEFDDYNNNNNNNLFTDEKKRSSFFRERDNKYDNVAGSVFREREYPMSSDSELTEEFLREIEDAQENEREQRYKDALRQLWEKYQQQDNEVDNDVFEEKKRMRVPPYYMLMQKKRSYPNMPWLPYNERKKRFPVAKRSTKRSQNDHLNFGKTDEKVEKELSELFGHGNADEEKKKRSVNEVGTTASTTTTTYATNTDAAKTTSALEAPAKKDEKIENDSEQMAVDTHGNEMHHSGHSAGYHGHAQKEHKHRKRSNHQHSQENDSREEDSEEHNEEEEEEEEDDGEHDGEHEDEHEDFEGEEDEEERKRKREVNTMKGDNKPVFKRSQNFFKPSSKKSVKWSKYFGLDRKKKAQSLEIKKRSADDDNTDDLDNDKDDSDNFDKKRSNLDPEKIDNMDRKLQSIEDFIIDDTVKYTGAHEGITSQSEIRRLKDHVLSRLATAYSLEKMRRALDKLRQSVENENHLLRNVIESDDSPHELKYQKRLTMKKDNAVLGDAPQLSSADKSKEIHSNSMMSVVLGAHNKHRNENDNDEDAKKKKQKKRNSYLRYPALPNELINFEEEATPGLYEALNDAYLGNKNYIIGSNQCPLIETMADRCRGVDLLSGDLNQVLLPACGVHQICYLCGTSQVACDYQYLDTADEICGNNNDCQAAARSVLMILRGTPGTQIGPKACLKNQCLYNAMREIGL